MQRQTYIEGMHPSGLNQLLTQGIFLSGLCDDATEIVLFFLFCHPRCPKNKARRGQKGQTREGPFAIQPEDIRGIRAPIVALTTGNGFYLYIRSSIYSDTDATKVAVDAKSGGFVGAQDEARAKLFVITTESNVKTSHAPTKIGIGQSMTCEVFLKSREGLLLIFVAQTCFPTIVGEGKLCCRVRK